MTTAWHNDRPASTLLRFAVVPAAVVALVCVIVSALVAGAPGLAGSLAGAGLVLAFFLVGLVALNVVRQANPSLLMLVGLLTYGVQVVGLLAVFAAVRGDEDIEETMSTSTLGVTVIVCTLAFSIGQVVAARKQRTPLYDEPTGAP